MKLTSVVTLSGALLMSTLVQAQGHEAKVAEWNPAELQANLAAMPKGDVARGKELNQTMMCASCHGEAGQALSRNWPSTAGQRVEYTYKTLQDYAQGRFQQHQGAGAMAAAASLLNQQQMADLAVYYAQQSLPVATVKPSLTKAEHKNVDIIVREGDAKRLITPCASCHGVKGEGGINETPALAGQEALYFERTMQAYKQGTRVTDSYGLMRMVASNLTDAEIKALAAYYANLPKPKSNK